MGLLTLYNIVLAQGSSIPYVAEIIPRGRAVRQTVQRSGRGKTRGWDAERYHRTGWTRVVLHSAVRLSSGRLSIRHLGLNHGH